jgi:hypothetical protein
MNFTSIYFGRSFLFLGTNVLREKISPNYSTTLKFTEGLNSVFSPNIRFGLAAVPAYSNLKTLLLSNSQFSVKSSSTIFSVQSDCVVLPTFCFYEHDSLRFDISWYILSCTNVSQFVGSRFCLILPTCFFLILFKFRFLPIKMTKYILLCIFY